MNKILKLSALFCAAVLTVVSCQEELDTAQYSSTAVTLASFGPNPAMRGSTVTFYGSNLDKVTEVNVPGMEPITGSAIEVVESGKTSQIRIVLDIEAPEVGYVTLKTSDGKELKTKSELTYKEPIVFDGFTAKAVNFPGETIKLKGTYMDLIKAVIFEGGEEVEVLEGATRHEAEVVIPSTAVTGVIILSDKEEIESLFYSKEELVMGEPTVTANAKAALKAGAEITVKGAHLDMIKKVVFDGAEVTDLTVAEDNKSFKFTLPATAKEGEYKAVSYADKEYKAGEFTAVMPTVTKVAPSPVKAGGKLTVTGTNLDLVTKVSCEGADNLTFSTTSDKEIVVDITAKAVEGELTLSLANESTVVTNFTTVHPTITAVTPTELYAGDEPIKVTGTDLDLIVSATLGGKAVEIKDQTATGLSIITDATAVSGALVLTLANGETVKAPDAIQVNYHSLVIVSERPAGQHIGELVTLKGVNMNLVESIYVGTEKVTKYVMRKDDEISFAMPWLKIGMYDLKFVLYNGDTETQPEQIEVLLERNIQTIYKGSQKVAWNDDDPWLDAPGNKALSALAYGAFDWSKVVPGTSLVIYYNKIEAAGYAQMRVGDGNWAAIPSWVERFGKGEADLDGDVMIHTLTKADIEALVAGNGMVICGHGYEITEVQLITEIPQEKTLWEGVSEVTWDGGAVTALSWGGYDFTTVEVGQQLIAYITVASGGQIRFGNGSWAALPTTKTFPNADGDGNITVTPADTKVSVTLSADDLTQLTTAGGLVVCGTGYTITKIALL
ncbi:MAG: hypothetical protein MJZ07_04935 [Bacteroidales bacterium]|nr:hypothetical protein [Bacteroidales bacterium]